ncbi:MAG: serine protein kinase RIO [Candidatus Woesearchaeota archaeon]
MAKITKEKFKTMHNVFDDFTNRNIYKLITQGYFEGLVGPVSIGKESNIFSAKKKNGEMLIIKIHRLETSDFNNMFEYLKYDPRYMNVKKNKRKLIFSWAQREFRNLVKAREIGVKVPKPIGFKDNIIIEEFIGDKEPAKMLKDSIPKDLKDFFEKVVKNMRKLFKGGLVHTDLSSFNILNHKENPVFIDFSQCTTIENNNSEEYLRRDIKNVCNFFRKHGLNNDDEEVFERIVKGK